MFFSRSLCMLRFAPVHPHSSISESPFHRHHLAHLNPNPASTPQYTIGPWLVPFHLTFCSTHVPCCAPSLSYIMIRNYRSRSRMLHNITIYNTKRNSWTVVLIYTRVWPWSEVLTPRSRVRILSSRFSYVNPHPTQPFCIPRSAFID